MTSIRNHLSLGLGVALVAVFVIAGAGSSLAIRQGIRDYMITRLDHDAETLLTAIEFPPAGDGAPVLAGSDPVFDRAYSGHYFKIAVDGDVLRSRSLWESDFTVPELAVGEARTLLATGPDDAPLLVRAHGFELRGRRIDVAVAEDFGPVHATILRWQAGFAAATVAAIVLVLLLQRRILGRSLQPLQRTGTEVRELEHGERRQLTTDAPAEILPLIQALNRLLETLEQRLKRSRKAAGDLAHGLKTPLSMLGSLVDRPATEPALRDEMNRQIAIIRGRMDRELRRARLMGGTAPGALFQPEIDAADLTDTLKRIHRDSGLTVHTRFTGDHPFPADREDMLELLGNLLDNAFKWADGRIELAIDSTAKALAISLEDDGPGIPADEIERLSRRGQRLDESREGHGLGLAIARDIVEFYSGTMELEASRPLGGLRVWVRLGTAQTLPDPAP